MKPGRSMLAVSLCLVLTGCAGLGAGYYPPNGAAPNEIAESEFPFGPLATESSERFGPLGFIWFAHFDITDPQPRWSDHARLRRALLTAKGYQCQNWNARGRVARDGWVSALMLATTDYIPRGGCSARSVGVGPPPALAISTEAFMDWASAYGLECNAVAAGGACRGAALYRVEQHRLLLDTPLPEERYNHEHPDYEPITRNDYALDVTRVRADFEYRYSPGAPLEMVIQRVILSEETQAVRS